MLERSNNVALPPRTLKGRIYLQTETYLIFFAQVWFQRKTNKINKSTHSCQTFYLKKKRSLKEYIIVLEGMPFLTKFQSKKKKPQLNSCRNYCWSIKCLDRKAHVYPWILKTWHCSNVLTGKQKGRFSNKTKRLDLTENSQNVHKFKQITALRVIGLTRPKTLSLSA